MRKIVNFAVATAAVLTFATSANAETILFDTNGPGGGGVVQVDLFDWAPGNSIIIEDVGNPLAGTILFQANLGSLMFGPEGLEVPVFANCGGGNCFTAVAAFDVTIAPGGGLFTINPGGTLKIYTNNTPGNNLTGLGFTTGTEILSATATVGAGSLIPSTDATVNLNPSAGCLPIGLLVNCLDQFNANNYPNFYTVNGSGGTVVEARVDSFNSAYFLNLIAGQSVSFTNTSNNLPYRQVDPSAQFSIDAVANGGTQGVSSVCGPGQGGLVPCINGTGNNIMAQADANTSFQGVTAIPEPASMTLLGLGLLGGAAARRRQQKNAKK